MASPFVELEVGARVVKVTNPQKILFPARNETKLDLVEYYLSVGDGIVRALRERPTQLRRFPDGVEGEMIYQKRVP
jgi:DNA primase